MNCLYTTINASLISSIEVTICNSYGIAVPVTQLAVEDVYLIV